VKDLLINILSLDQFDVLYLKKKGLIINLIFILLKIKLKTERWLYIVDLSKTYALKLYEFFYVFEFSEKLGSNILNCGKVLSYTKNSFGM